MAEDLVTEQGELERTLVNVLDGWSEELFEFVAAAVQVPSVTGDETAFGEFLSDWLRGHGFETYTRAIEPAFKERLGGFGAEVDLERRPNVFAWLRAEDSGARRPLVISTHQDVVSPGAPEAWSRDPWGGDRDGARIWGRGSVDMKGSIGAAVFALRALAESGISPGCDVELQCVVAEESGGLGTLSALETEPAPSAAIVLEPSECTARPACSGCVHFTVTLEGRSAHAATPWVGVSALDKLIVAYSALQALAERRRARQDHPLFASLPDGAPLSMGVARAGEWRSTVAERAVMTGRLGVMPGESLAEARREIAEAVDEAAEADSWLRDHPPVVSWDNEGFAAWETAAEEPIVRVLSEAATAAGAPGGLGAVTYGSDAGHFASRGVPVVIFGPGRISNAHAPDEFVEQHEILLCAKTLALALTRHGSSSPSGASGPA